MTIIVLSIVLTLSLIVFLIPNSDAQSVVMDVECAVYEHSDDVNGNDVDVRIFLQGLKADYDYTAKVTPDHNPSTNVTSKTDSDGIYWAIAKIPNGEKSLIFNVDVYEGKNTNGQFIASGSDNAPCFGIAFSKIQ